MHFSVVQAFARPIPEHCENGER